MIYLYHSKVQCIGFLFVKKIEIRKNMLKDLKNENFQTEKLSDFFVRKFFRPKFGSAESFSVTEFLNFLFYLNTICIDKIPKMSVNPFF